MKHHIPAYIAFIIAFLFFSLGYIFKNNITSVTPIVPTQMPSPLPTSDSGMITVEPGTSNISQAITPGTPELYCEWCGESCIPGGFEHTCPTVERPAGYNCEKRTVNGIDSCQKIKKEDSNIVCDVANPCSDGQECVIYENSTDARAVCVSGNPCDRCSSKKCVTQMSYPERITCLDANAPTPDDRRM